MEKRNGVEPTKAQRMARRARQRKIDRQKEEQNRRRALGGGQPDELGVFQGRSGEQGSIVEPRKVRRFGRSVR